MLDWLRRRIGGDRVPWPALVRVRHPDGAPVETVECTATWYPSGRRVTRRRHTGAGLCVIPWRSDERRVHLEFAAGPSVGWIELERDRADGGRARELRLGAPG